MLVLADGSGRDSTWLATQGHRVTAVELSRVATGLARNRAVQHNVAVDVICGDAAAWVDTEQAHGPWDGLLSVFGHLGSRENAHVAHKLRPTLGAGGSFVITTSPLVSTEQDFQQA